MNKERRLTLAKWSNSKEERDISRNKTEENMNIVFRMFRLKQIQHNSKQYSSLEWTDPNTISRIDNSRADETLTKKEKK